MRCAWYMSRLGRIVFGFDMSLPVRQHRTENSIRKGSGITLRHVLSLKCPSLDIRGEGSKNYLRLNNYAFQSSIYVHNFHERKCFDVCVATDQCDPDPPVLRIFESRLKNFYGSLDEGLACQKVCVHTWRLKRRRNTGVCICVPSGIGFHDASVLAVKELTLLDRATSLFGIADSG
jgi:hypothetical protein